MYAGTNIGNHTNTVFYLIGVKNVAIIIKLLMPIGEEKKDKLYWGI